MVTIVNESIQVGAVFSSGKIVPRFFVWKKTKYSVSEITYFWRSKIGRALVFNFAVKSGVSVYEIAYHTEQSEWSLKKLYVE